MFQSRPKGQKKCSDQHSFTFLSQVSEQVCVDSKNELERRMTRAKELYKKCTRIIHLLFSYLDVP